MWMGTEGGIGSSWVAMRKCPCFLPLFNLLIESRSLGQVMWSSPLPMNLTGLKWDASSSDNEVWTELCHLKIPNFAPAGVAQRIECWPANQRITILIPSQDTWLGWGDQVPSGDHAWGNHPLMFLSSLYPSLPLFIKINKWNLLKMLTSL